MTLLRLGCLERESPKDPSQVVDIPGEVGMAGMPPVPDGYEIARVDVIVRLRKKG